MPHKKPSNSKTSFNEERILSEIIDLWFELRAIREMMEEDYAPELPTLKLDLSGPFERFVAKLSELEGDWSNAKEEMNFFFRAHITPDLLAFEQLSDEDKKLLIN